MMTKTKDNKKNNYIKSCLNYTGGKYNLLEQIIPLFPKKIETFYDIFCGGANVAINIDANKIVCIDKQRELIRLFSTFKETNIDEIIFNIEMIIKKYQLSCSYQYGYEKYNTNSQIGLANYNRNRYIKLREDYNSIKFKDFMDSFMLYVISVYSFNNQIRFNKNGECNIPVGKRDFNKNIRKNLIKFLDRIKNINIEFHCEDFKNINIEKINKNDFVYADPPYLITNATYNEGNGWTEQDEIDLLLYLDKLNEKGIKFALSNVFEINGKVNNILKEWAKKYNIHYLNYNYNNSNYQKRNKSSKTTEVLIVNY